jgi:hypothetical protein
VEVEEMKEENLAESSQKTPETTPQTPKKNTA